MKWLLILSPILLGAPKKESAPMWHEYSMEAFSRMGESLYREKNYNQAHRFFQNSLQTSVKIIDPTSSWMGVDLYRMAQIDAQNGRLPEAQKNLEILIHRYPESLWRAPAEELLELVLKNMGQEGDKKVPAQDLPLENESFLLLQNLWTEATEGRPKNAVQIANQFLKRYPRHPAAGEVRFLQALLFWKMGAVQPAQTVLKELFDAVGEGTFKSKVRYFLSAIYAAAGDYASIEFTVPSLEPGQDGSQMDRWMLLAQFWKALALLNSGDMEQAKRHVQMALRAGPESPIQAYAWEMSAVLSDQEGNVLQALNQMRRAYEMSKQWNLQDLESSTLLSMGHIYYKQSQWASAKKAYEKFLSDRPNPSRIPAVLYHLGLVQKKMQETEGAIRDFAELAHSYPQNELAPHAYLQLGQIHWNKGQVDEAIRSYQAMRQAAPSDPEWERESILLTAQCYYNTKQFGQAVPLYKEFLEKASNDERAPQVQALLLTCYFLWKPQDAELESLLAAYPALPITAYIRWELGVAAYKKKDYASAKQNFERVWIDFPKTSYAPGALYYFGECLIQEKDYASAIAGHRLMLERYPKHALAKQSLFKLAAALYETKQYEESAERFGEYLSKNSKDSTLAADALFNQSLAWSQSKNTPLALKSYEELMERYPRYPQYSWIWLQIGSLSEELGRWNRAIEAYSHIPLQKPERLQAQWAIGRCYERLKNIPLAQKTYEGLTELDPKDSYYRLSSMARLALLYELQNKQRKASRLYKEVVRYPLEPALAQMVQERMRFIEQRQQEILSSN